MFIYPRIACWAENPTYTILMNDTLNLQYLSVWLTFLSVRNQTVAFRRKHLLLKQSFPQVLPEDRARTQKSGFSSAIASSNLVHWSCVHRGGRIQGGFSYIPCHALFENACSTQVFFIHCSEVIPSLRCSDEIRLGTIVTPMKDNYPVDESWDMHQGVNGG